MKPVFSSTTLSAPTGTIQLLSSGSALVGLYLREQQSARWTTVEKTDEVLTAASRQLEEYFAGARTRFDVPIALEGTDFQRQVWRALLEIPFGETATYAEIARAIRRPSACRAVGAANGQNPISIIVPCHRVCGSDGSLTGYGGGLPSKRWLLDHEASIARPRGEQGQLFVESRTT